MSEKKCDHESYSANGATLDSLPSYTPIKCDLCGKKGVLIGHEDGREEISFKGENDE